MPFAKDTYTATAGQTAFSITFDMLQNDHLELTIDSTPSASFTVNTAGTTLTYTGTALSGGESVVITRVTPVTVAGQLVDPTAGARLLADDLDKLRNQLLYVLQELLDGRTTD